MHIVIKMNHFEDLCWSRIGAFGLSDVELRGDCITPLSFNFKAKVERYFKVEERGQIHHHEGLKDPLWIERAWAQQ